MTATDHLSFDVAVIGAGPMGSFAAERMAQRGLRVGLFEKDVHPGDSTVCAGGMHHDLVRYLDLPSDQIEKTIPIFRVVMNGRASEWKFTRPTYVTVDRRNLDVFLAERAVQAGATLVTRYVCGFVSAKLAADTCVEAFRGGRFKPHALLRYATRLRRTRYYLTIRLMERVLGWMAGAYRRSQTVLYLPFMKLYFHVMHVAMRFVRVI